MEIYLDNSATTRVIKPVADRVAEMMLTEYGNPSSMHLLGVKAERVLREARETIASTLRVNEKEIFFTSGGTESDNLAILGVAEANKRKGRHIITTKIEHAAILQCMKYLESQDYEVTYLSTDSEGVISLDELKAAMREDTILVSIMAVNNEIGAVEPIEEAGKLIKEINPDTYFHVDAVQAYGKIRLAPKRMKIDLLSVSGHKIHGPKGVGFLYISDKVKIRPQILGGGQQKGMRSGTDNVPGIAGLAVAAKETIDSMEDNVAKMYELRKSFTESLSEIENVRINGPENGVGAPHIVSLSVKGVRAEVLLHALEEKGIYVSAGSACSSNKPAVSETLKSIGLDKDLLGSTIRFSFSSFTTKEELDETVKALKELLPVLRKFVRR